MYLGLNSSDLLKILVQKAFARITEFILTESASLAVEIKEVVKSFGNFKALNQVSLQIRDNEFFTLLGPSGCGKTTLLRLIAGFEQVTEGAIYLFNEEIELLPPNKRPVNTVFQNYALFPHMTVFENVCFGLQMLGKPKSEIPKRASEMLDLVQLTEFTNRKPAQLSGGQQQRVALARALAPSPKVLLLDEPLSALDLKLRKAMQSELKYLQRETGITFIFVTHDQEEALTMSDRIAVMSAGEIQQIGDPRSIYEQPNNVFVADFIGETNLLEVQVESIENGQASCKFGENQSILCPVSDEIDIGKTVHLSIRPERLYISREKKVDQSFKGKVLEQVFNGTDISVKVELDQGYQMSVRAPNSSRNHIELSELGSEVYVNPEDSAIRMLVD